MSTTLEGAIADHYTRARPVYEILGELDGLLTPGNADYNRWYASKPDAPAGWDGTARAFALAPDYDELAETVERSVYTSVNYASRDYFARSWAAYRWGDDEREWKDGANPLPGYGDIQAYAPFVDIDLADDVKTQRPDGDVPKETIAGALALYIDEFAALGGGSDAVHALDSVGGAYVMLAPSTTAPIAQAFDRPERALIFDELTDRLNTWLESVADRVLDAVPEVEDTFEPDLVNHKNRLYKAPLSVHSSLDGVVTPIDTNAPTFDYTPLDAADVAQAEAWAESYTDDYSGHVASIVASLWPTYYGKVGDWETALREWLDDELAADEPDDNGGDGGGDHTPGADVAPEKVVYRALDGLDVHDVAGDTIVAGWNEGAHTSSGATAFFPTWAPNCNGTANIVVESKGIWVDTGQDHKGGVVEMALINAGGWTRGTIAKGRDWIRGIVELRKLGYDVPLPAGDPDNFDGSDYYALPLEGIAMERLGDASGLYDDREKLLKTCLLARDEYDTDVGDATPPYKVLVEIADRVGLKFKDPDENVLGKDSHRLAGTIFDEMSADDV